MSTPLNICPNPPRSPSCYSGHRFTVFMSLPYSLQVFYTTKCKIISRKNTNELIRLHVVPDKYFKSNGSHKVLVIQEFLLCNIQSTKVMQIKISFCISDKHIKVPKRLKAEHTENQKFLFSVNGRSLHLYFLLSIPKNWLRGLESKKNLHSTSVSSSDPLFYVGIRFMPEVTSLSLFLLKNYEQLVLRDVQESGVSCSLNLFFCQLTDGRFSKCDPGQQYQHQQRSGQKCSQVPPETYWIRTTGGEGSAICVLRSPGWFWSFWWAKFENYCAMQIKKYILQTHTGGSVS